jgi:hypothetical protein
MLPDGTAVPLTITNAGLAGMVKTSGTNVHVAYAIDTPVPPNPAVSVSGNTVTVSVVEDYFPVSLEFCPVLGVSPWDVILSGTNGIPGSMLSTNLPISTGSGFFVSFRPYPVERPLRIRGTAPFIQR